MAVNGLLDPLLNGTGNLGYGGAHLSLLKSVSFD